MARYRFGNRRGRIRLDEMGRKDVVIQFVNGSVGIHGAVGWRWLMKVSLRLIVGMPLMLCDNADRDGPCRVWRGRAPASMMPGGWFFPAATRARDLSLLAVTAAFLSRHDGSNDG